MQPTNQLTVMLVHQTVYKGTSLCLQTPISHEMMVLCLSSHHFHTACAMRTVPQFTTEHRLLPTPSAKCHGVFHNVGVRRATVRQQHEGGHSLELVGRSGFH